MSSFKKNVISTRISDRDLFISLMALYRKVGYQPSSKAEAISTIVHAFATMAVAKKWVDIADTQEDWEKKIEEVFNKKVEIKGGDLE